jgi:hypothetical protein
MLTQSPMANVIIVLAIALGVIVVVDMVVLPMIQAEAKCNFNHEQNRFVGHCMLTNS